MRSRAIHLTWNRIAALALTVVIAGCGSGTNGAGSSTSPDQGATASNTPTPTATPFAAKIPIALPAPQGTGPNAITFANILDHVAEIPKAAWTRVQQTIAANSEVPLEVVINLGPNTQFDVIGGKARIREVLARTARLWSGFAQSGYISVIAYNAKDEPWAEQNWAEIAKARAYTPSDVKFRRGAIRGNCQSSTSPGVFSGPVTSCGGADAGAVFGSNDAVMALGQLGGSNDIFLTSGGGVGHEYTHTAQAGNWIGHSECMIGGICNRTRMANHGFSPCWLHEGQPQAAGVAAAFEKLADYLNYAESRPYGWGPTTVTDYSQPSLRDYLYNQTAVTCYKNGALYLLGYSVGALATEALIAIAGPQATMALFALGANGQDFSTAFENVYGISWEQGATILSKVLAAEYATFGPPPK